MTDTLKYAWEVAGTAADGQTWKVNSSDTVSPGDFTLVPQLALRAAFYVLTQGKAVYGKPGVACKGPYRVTRMVIEMEG
jgi:hypothetical protein